MKNKLDSITIFLLFALALFTLMAFTTVNRAKIAPIPLELNPTLITSYEIKIEEVEIEIKGHDQFLDAIGFRESGNRYNIVNKYGYMGKYQFGRSTLRGLGFKVTQDEFLNSPYIQEKAMQSLLEHNYKKLKKQIKKYCGKTINGVYVTESGILAAAHLAGQGNVKRFFKKGNEFEDGFGTKMTTYMAQFGGYYLDL
jgi:hypothetical protein